MKLYLSGAISANPNYKKDIDNKIATIIERVEKKS